MRMPIIGKWNIRRKIIWNAIVITVLAIIAGIIAGLLSMNMGGVHIDTTVGVVALAIVIIILAVLIYQLRRNLAAQEQQLEDRANRLEVAIDISQRFSAILDLSTLMKEVVINTKETFNYYHIHIYLVDETRENLYVAEGYGRAGEELKAKGHKFSVNAQQSLVARSARERQIINVGNVRDDPTWAPNPILPGGSNRAGYPTAASYLECWLRYG